jgi:hypothetical protein
MQGYKTPAHPRKIHLENPMMSTLCHGQPNTTSEKTNRGIVHQKKRRKNHIMSRHKRAQTYSIMVSYGNSNIIVEDQATKDKTDISNYKF